MQIKFHSKFYNVIGYNNVEHRLQVTIEKGDDTFDSIISDTVDAEEIIIVDGEETIGIFTGYTHRVAICIYSDDTVSVELENTEVKDQIANLEAQVQAQESAIAELGEAVSSESETNSVQDAAISELADAVSTITPEEV